MSDKKTFCLSCDIPIPIGSLDEKDGNGGFYCSNDCRDRHREKVIEDLGLMLTGYKFAMESVEN